MNKHTTTILLLLGAVATGGAGWFLTHKYVDSQVTDYKVKVDKQLDTIPLVVASKEMQPGMLVSAENVSVRQVPRAFAPSTASGPNQFSQLKGRQIIYKVAPGEPILPSHLAKVSASTFSSILNKGERALTIPVDSKNSISGFLRPGDLVDMFITLNPDAQSPQARTLPLISNVKILATGTHIEGQADIPSKGRRADDQYSEITVGVSPKDAGRIVHAQSLGTLSLVMRAREDETDFKDYVSIDNLTDIKVKPAAAPVAPPAVSKMPSGVQIIRGGKT